MSKRTQSSSRGPLSALAEALEAWRLRPAAERRPSDAAALLDAADSAVPPSARSIDKNSAGAWLDATGRPEFLRLLDRKTAERWAETAFRLIRVSRYSLLDLFLGRVREIPRNVLFQDMSASIPEQWTYEEAGAHIREIAGALHVLAAADGSPPRVAIFSDNRIESACVDLACLFYDILDTPLNPHFSQADLAAIFDSLGINLVVTDTEERAAALLELRRRTARPFRVLALRPGMKTTGDEVFFLGEYVRSLGVEKIDGALARRRRLKLNEVATVMFTSGSTGTPKGVSFSIYQLVAKRFARGAALPAVGEDEVLLSFLPLYHTFGRYFELLGTVYWRGTYVFAGNPSAETLLALFPKVNPTGFVSVPVRWLELYEKCLERIDAAPAGGDPAQALRAVVGSRLRWGLSAAGYLDPRVFRFFERHGIDVCSGFGMTEGTGGITMTIPGRYEDNTHGVPLPGTRVRLAANGELQVSGHYVARYLEDKGPGDIIPYPRDPASDYWLSTGDVFRRLPSGYYQIVDRIKDIYKNNRGQTIAPRKVESKFGGVPGFKRTFLVGDGRPWNVLLIVPDYGDEVLKAALDRENARAYYRRIVTAANLDLAPYERVVNFAVADRDLDAGRGEITPKGSYNRKRIETDFAAEIDALYRTNWVDLEWENVRVRVPLWIFRDLGILEDEMTLDGQGLHDLDRKCDLPLRWDAETGAWLIGDLEYVVRGEVIDLGIFARQPHLWAGNPALVSFCPCREGWDVPLETVSDRVGLPWQRTRVYAPAEFPRPGRSCDPSLARVHALLSRVLFGEPADAEAALDEVETFFGESENLRLSTVVRRRLEALARHPGERVRCRAYRLLLLDEPNPTYGESLPAFVQSGLPFLNEESVEYIVSSRLGQGRFDSLRQRMCAYRETLEWPAAEPIRRQFERIFRLLVDFAGVHPEYYASVRAELAGWILHKCDPDLSGSAGSFLDELNRDFQGWLASGAPVLEAGDWDGRLVFEEGFDAREKEALRTVLTHPLFLRESVLLAYESERFNPAEIAERGVWVSRLPGGPDGTHARVSVNTRTGRHFDLHFACGGEWRSARGVETALWLISLSSYPYGKRIVPRLGGWRPELGALSWRYSGDLTVWEKVREFAGRHESETVFPAPQTWRKLFIDSFSAFFRAADYGGFRIVPGLVSPSNVIVPELDFREEAVIASLEGWDEYAGPLSLVRPMLDNFYRRTAAGYPWAVRFLDVTWIFDACYEALGYERAGPWLEDLRRRLETEPVPGLEATEIAAALDAYLTYFRRNYMIPIPALNAINKYKDWEIAHTAGSAPAREGKVLELFEKYALDRYPEIVRYYFYRHTYFAGLGGGVCAAFDRLLERMTEDVRKPAQQRLELSDLQATLTADDDRRVFSKMVFPKLRGRVTLDILKFGEEGAKQVIVHSRIEDAAGAAYAFSETYDPTEIGLLYRLFFRENYPKVISDEDRHFVVKDAEDRVVGGLCYHAMYKNVMFIDAVVVSSPLKNRGLGRAMLDDFCARMAGLGAAVVLTHFFLPAFFLRSGFVEDKRWGALVKYL